MKARLTEAWAHVGVAGATRYDRSKWNADHSILWVTLCSDRMKWVKSGVYRYTLCDGKDLDQNKGARHQTNVLEAIDRGMPIRGFLVWPRKELNAKGGREIAEADPTRQYAVEVESRDGDVIVVLAKGLAQDTPRGGK